MFTILIPVLKPGYLQSQLHWLSTQTYKNFCVLVMDSGWKQNRHQSWAEKKYPFKLWHLPIVHNVRQHKTHDFSVKNNLALLSPTNNFVMLSDTHYITPDFCAVVADEIVKHRSCVTLFEAGTLMYTAYSQNTLNVDMGGETLNTSKPAILFDAKTFFYVLQGYDEVTTYCHGYENMYLRASILMRDKLYRVTKKGYVYHILHENHDNDFGPHIKLPCEKCSTLFAPWKFDIERDYGEFPEGGDPETLEQFTSYDSVLGTQVFQCPNCGFCGTTESFKLDASVENRGVSAPHSLFDGDVGRNIIGMYETITTKVNNRMGAKLAYLKTTY